MNGTLNSILVQYPIFTLFVVIGLGYLLGEISFFGFKLGVAGVLFMGIVVGAMGPGIAVPEAIPSLGLIIFVYTIGIQCGPGFFSSFREQGWRQNLFAAAVLTLAAVLTFGLGRALRLGGPQTAGLYCGALTNTPALAAARERLRDRARGQQLPAEQIRTLADEPVVGYGIAYPMGVVGVLLCFQLARRLWGGGAIPREAAPSIRTQDFVVKNPGVFGRAIGDVMHLHKEPRFVISRVQQGGQTQLVRPDLRLGQGDLVVVVGEEEGLQLAQQLFGEPSDQHLELDRSVFDFRRVFVSSKQVVGRRIRELDLENRLAATITRLRRGDVDVVPALETRLEFGDRVRVLTKRANFSAIAEFFGDSMRGTAETDFGSVALGMVLGVLLGMMPIPLPGGHTVRLGLAGGPLLVALVLGALERTGRICWVIPFSANLTLRQIGLLLFLAGVGINAGYLFLQTVRTSGMQMLLAGAAITFAVALTTLFLGHRLFKLPLDSLMGLVSGVQTQPAALAFAEDLARTERPSLAYASVFPVAMIVKIVLAQLLV
jgi:putative transport protein